MKPATLDIERSGNLGGQRVAMTVDASALVHIMSVLTDLYSDPEMAIIREYSTNARDAHIDAGQTRPIEISTPTALMPYFKVKDYGLGLDITDIEDIYSKYGASTKRDSDLMNGVLGLGCKSALSYTNQFTLTAVKNGQKSVVSVSRSEDGSGVMEVIDTGTSVEGNSVEVSIPVKRYNEIDRKVRTFFQFWDPSTYLVNGQTFDQVKGSELSPGIYLNGEIGYDTIVMGGVSYPVNEALYAYRSSGYGYAAYNQYVVAYVDMGAINFTPSREAMQYTAQTKATVQHIIDTVQSEVLRVAAAEVVDAVDHMAALKAYDKWYNILGAQVFGNVQYKGEDVPRVFPLDLSHMGDPKPDQWGHVSRVYGFSFNPSGGSYSSATGRYNGVVDKNVTQFDIRDVVSPRALTVCYNFGVNLNPTQRAKIKKWYEDNNNGVWSTSVKMFFTNKVTDLMKTWLPADSFVDWEEINKIQIVSNTGAGSSRAKRRGSYDVLDTALDYFKQSDTFDQTKPIIYYSTAEAISDGSARAFDKASKSRYTIIKLNRNRWDKLKREFPKAQHITAVASKVYKSVVAGLTDFDKLYENTSGREKRFLGEMDQKRIIDPDLKALVKLCNASTRSASLLRYHEARGMRSLLPRSEQITNLDITGIDPLEKYPLVSAWYTYNYEDHAHLYEYITMIYNKGV